MISPAKNSSARKRGRRDSFSEEQQPVLFDRVPPHDENAEMAVLGGMLMSKDAVGEVSQNISENDFYLPKHQTIYRAIIDLFASSEPADTVTVANALMRDDQLDVLNVGEQSYDYYRIADLEGIDHLPYSLKVLVENLVYETRHFIELCHFGFSFRFPVLLRVLFLLQVRPLAAIHARSPSAEFDAPSDIRTPTRLRPRLLQTLERELAPGGRGGEVGHLLLPGFFATLAKMRPRISSQAATSRGVGFLSLRTIGFKVTFALPSVSSMYASILIICCLLPL